MPHTQPPVTWESDVFLCDQCRTKEAHITPWIPSGSVPFTDLQPTWEYPWIKVYNVGRIRLEEALTFCTSKCLTDFFATVVERQKPVLMEMT